MKKIFITALLLIGVFSFLMNKASAQTSKVTMVFSVYVNDYDAWKNKFEAGAQFRADAGIKVISISRNVDDTNAITIIEEAANKESAKDFIDKLKALREKAGDKSLASVELFEHLEIE
jgi:hypothetical protein